MNTKNESQQNSVEEILEYLERLSENKLDSERRREESIIQQASNMQTAFAFSTAALFMIATIIYDYRGDFSFCYFFVVFASITALLLLSLVFATKAQNRMETTVFPEIKQLYDHIEKNYELFVSKEQRSKYFIECCAEAQESLTANNGKRVKCLRYSMRIFYSSITVSVAWTIITVIIWYTKGGI